MADNSVEIKALQKILNTAASRIQTGGASVQLDLKAAKDRLKELKANDDATIAAAKS